MRLFSRHRVTLVRQRGAFDATLPSMASEHAAAPDRTASPTSSRAAPTSRACGRCAAIPPNTIARCGGTWPSSAGSASSSPKRTAAWGSDLPRPRSSRKVSGARSHARAVHRVRRARGRRARGCAERSAQAVAPAAASCAASSRRRSRGRSDRPRSTARTSRRGARRSKAVTA